MDGLTLDRQFFQPVGLGLCHARQMAFFLGPVAVEIAAVILRGTIAELSIDIAIHAVLLVPLAHAVFGGVGRPSDQDQRGVDIDLFAVRRQHQPAFLRQLGHVARHPALAFSERRFAEVLGHDLFT